MSCRYFNILPVVLSITAIAFKTSSSTRSILFDNRCAVLPRVSRRDPPRFSTTLAAGFVAAVRDLVFAAGPVAARRPARVRRAIGSGGAAFVGRRKLVLAGLGRLALGARVVARAGSLAGGVGGLLVLPGRGDEATLGTCLAVSCWRDIALVTRIVGSNTLGRSASLLSLSTLGSVASALGDTLLFALLLAVSCLPK